MKLPNWFKVIWWLLLVGLLTAYLVPRYSELTAGRAVPSDLVVFVIWVALLLAPLFGEVSLVGITLKQQIDELKDYVAAQIVEVKSEVRSAVDVHTIFSPHFNIAASVPDAQLPWIKQYTKAAVSNALAERGIQQPLPPAQVAVSDDVAFLFATRYNLEKELRRVGESREVIGETRPPMSALHLIRALAQTELLEPRLANAIREVYSVCSPGVHGVPITEAQVAFVREVGPDLIATLKTIK